MASDVKTVLPLLLLCPLKDSCLPPTEFDYSSCKASDEFQDWMRARGKFYGDWKCKCGVEVEFSCKPNCPECGSKMKFLGMPLEGMGTRGRVYAAYRDANKHFWIIAYANKAPTEAERVLLNRLALVLDSMYDLTVAGWMHIRQSPLTIEDQVIDYRQFMQLRNQAEAYQSEVGKPTSRLCKNAKHYGKVRRASPCSLNEDCAELSVKAVFKNCKERP